MFKISGFNVDIKNWIIAIAIIEFLNIYYILARIIQYIE